MRFSFLPVIVLMMPILEIAGFIVVGKALGLWLTLALILFTSFLGLVILRSGGLGMVRNLQTASRSGDEPAQAMINGVCALLLAFCCLCLASLPMLSVFFSSFPLSERSSGKRSVPA